MKTCKDCNKEKPNSEYYGVQNDCKDCYRARVRTQKDRFGVERQCAECDKTIKVLQSELRRGGGKVCSRDCYYERQPKLLRAKFDRKFKDKKMSYEAVHEWVKRERGRPNYCEFCKQSGEGTYDWSNVSGEYRRDLDDWQRLCRKCHIKYDGSVGKRKATIKRKEIR